MTTAFIDDIRAGLAEHACPANAAAMQRYMKTDMAFAGVTTPVVTSVTRAALARHPITDRGALESTVRAMFRDATYREEWYAAVGLLRRPALTRLLTADSVDLLAWIAVRSAWWDVVDALYRPLRSLLLAHRPEVEPVIRSWIAGDELWLRRLTLICQLGLRDATDLDLLTDAVEAAQNEPGFFLRKGIGWALREYSKTDGVWVRAFVDAHPGLSPLSRREALKWLARQDRERRGEIAGAGASGATSP